MDEPPPIDPATMAQLLAYAAQPRSPKARPWTADELLSLLDPAVPVTTIMDRLGVARHIVTFELIWLRRAGFPVPRRPGNWARSPRSLAIEEDLRAGMTGAEVARRHGVTASRRPGCRNSAPGPASQLGLACGLAMMTRCRHKRRNTNRDDRSAPMVFGAMGTRCSWESSLDELLIPKFFEVLRSTLGATDEFTKERSWDL